LWLLNEANYAGLSLGPLSDSSLDANRFAKVTASFEKPVFQGDGILVSGINYGPTAFFDELRVGTTLADVLPTAVPEPGAMMSVVGLLLVGLAGVRVGKMKRK
jgi:hypothetical protein